MKNLRGKKLLILGGSVLVCDIVKKAKEMGIYTIVTDWYETSRSPAKLIADEYAMISTGDIDSLVVFAKEKNINGVFTSFVDSTLPYAQILCEKLNMPFYASKSQLEKTIDKQIFKSFCRKNDIPVVEEYHINVNDSTDNIKFPIVIKPVDSSGAKGISFCFEKEEFGRLYEKAISFSKSKKVIFEKLMRTEGININLDYVITDGTAYLSAVGDLYSYSESREITPITSAVFYPSVYTEDYIKQLDEKAKNLFKDMGLKNGFLYIQAFHDENGYHFYEMGYRLGGGQSYVMIEKMNGVNHLEMLLNYSLTGRMCAHSKIQKINPFFKKSACGLCLIVGKGKIMKINGIDKIKKIPGVIKFSQFLHLGHEISEHSSGTVEQLFGRVHIVDKTRGCVEDIIEKIFSALEIIGENNENLLLKSYERND